MELIPTVSAGPTGLKPSASVIITAAPRSKIDGGQVGGTTVTFTGTIADLAAPFTLSGTGPGFTVEFSFTPTSADAGSLSYTGSGGGVTLTGSGTYTITGDDPDVLTLNYNAQGCADPGACRSTSSAITLTAVT